MATIVQAPFNNLCGGVINPLTCQVFPLYEVLERKGATVFSSPNSAMGTAITNIAAGTIVARLDNVLYGDQTAGTGFSFFRVLVSVNPSIQGFMISQSVPAGTATVMPFLAQTPKTIALQYELELCCQKCKKLLCCPCSQQCSGNGQFCPTPCAPCCNLVLGQELGLCCDVQKRRPCSDNKKKKGGHHRRHYNKA